MFRNIVVGMSGGVDSAVTALLLKNKGYNVKAVFMKCWDIRDESQKCTMNEDYKDAQWICNKLNIPLIEVDFVKEYWNNVFSDLIDKYQSGLGPNPDVLCNKYIKFEKFFHFARNQLQADAIATGHYIKTSFGPYLEYFQANSDVHLLHAHDTNKDQTFFLCQVPQKSLRYCMFPLGKYLKSEVKKIAMEAGLEMIAKKKESTGICFIGKREFQNFISEYINNKPGEFRDLDSGCTVGHHNGIHQWTIGQRVKGIYSPKAYFILYKDIKNNEILVVDKSNHPALYTSFVKTDNPYWIIREPKELQRNSGLLNCYFRYQHRDPLIPCTVFKALNNQLYIRISEPLRALTKGQWAVLHSRTECLGSATISSLGPSYFGLKQPIIIETMRREHEERVSRVS